MFTEQVVCCTLVIKRNSIHRGMIYIHRGIRILIHKGTYTNAQGYTHSRTRVYSNTHLCSIQVIPLLLKPLSEVRTLRSEARNSYAPSP